MHLSVIVLAFLVACSCGAAWWANRRRPEFAPPKDGPGAARISAEPTPQAQADEA